MAAPKFIVTSEPGTYIAGIGFVKVGEAYTAPAGHIPSRTALPLNVEACTALKKIQAELLARAKSIVEDAKDGDEADKKAARSFAKTLASNAAAIRVEPLNIQREAPVVEEGLTIEELEGLKGGNPAEAPGEKQPNRKL
jgi:hypothetical protein